MPLKKDDLDKRGNLPTGDWRETDDVPVGHMVYHLAESIANAQTKLDLNAAEVARTLDETEVEVVPRIVQRVDEDGNVTTERDDPVKRTLLELGFTPSRYHFSEAVIEVDFDTKMSEESETDAESNVGMRAGTSEARQHRKYNRSVETNTHVKAKLEPMAPPRGLTPERATQPAQPTDAEGPEDDAADAGADGDGGAGDSEAATSGNEAGAGSGDGAGEAAPAGSAADGAATDQAGGDGEAQANGAEAPPDGDRAPTQTGAADGQSSGSQR